MFRLAACLLLGVALSIAGPITFNIGNPVGIGSISGTIQTDGTLGVIGTGNIIDWNLVLNDGTGTFTLLGPASGNNSQVLVQGSDLSETATALSFNFSGSGLALFQNPGIGTGINYFCMEAITGCTGSPAGESLYLTTGTGNQFTARQGTQVVATAGPTGTPEPSTLGLFGLGAAVLAVRRRLFVRG